MATSTLTPRTSGKFSTEAARAAALATHSAASLAGAAGFREAARLLRASEALARAAVATLLAHHHPLHGHPQPPGNGDGKDDTKKKTRRSRKKKSSKQIPMEDISFGPIPLF